ncbi:MAG: DUF47 family protein, partial [Veillonellaceae bacterium]|nr:DUF47 family protein [Veillonellaceae bacterium]
MFNFKKKDTEFFDLFVQSAQYFYKGALLMDEVMLDYSKAENKVKEINDIEHEADAVNDQIIDKLNMTFITPIDREDFYHLSSQLKFCIDHLHGTIRRLENYHIKEANPAAIEVMQILVDMATEMKDLFGKLKSISRNEVVLIEGAEQLGTQERKIDHLYRAEISRLFDGSQELFDVIRWKDIMDTLEN